MITIVKENDLWVVKEVDHASDGWYKRFREARTNVETFMKSCDMSSKESYLEWVKTWKEAYKLLSKLSRRAKIGRKESKPETYFDRSWEVVFYCWLTSTSMLYYRAENKTKSAEARKAAKEAA